MRGAAPLVMIALGLGIALPLGALALVAHLFGSWPLTIGFGVPAVLTLLLFLGSGLLLLVRPMSPGDRRS